VLLIFVCYINIYNLCGSICGLFVSGSEFYFDKKQMTELFHQIPIIMIYLMIKTSFSPNLLISRLYILRLGQRAKLQ